MSLPSYRPRILIIDDDPVIVELACAVLGKANMECISAKDGGEGLTRAQRDRPDIIIIDRSMPIMTGSQCLARLKRNAMTARIPVIMLTGSSQPEDVAESLALGIDDYIVKPFEPNELASRVQRVLGGFSRTKKRPC